MKDILTAGMFHFKPNLNLNISRVSVKSIICITLTNQTH